MSPDIAPHVRSALPLLRSCWFLMLAASLVWAGLGMIASPVLSPTAGATWTPATAAIAALGVISAAATIWLDRAILAPARIAGIVPIHDLALVKRHLLARHLALWSLAQVPALFGFAQLLLDGSPEIHLALCALALAILALLMPTRARIAARMEAALFWQADETPSAC